MPKKKKLAKTLARPPIVAILGHVDHGKTTLLDYIRKSDVAEGEHGGITQHIGAYQIDRGKDRITFIDTPGHAAFAQMRARGAQVTDLVVLVVAANDGVKPQTIESIKHIQEADVPLIVAVNKIDLPQASSEMVKAQLTEHDVFVEGYGGQTPLLELSAKTGDGVDQLLDMILLMAELEELKASDKNPLEAVVIESGIDKKRGSIATLIVKDGKLLVGDEIYSGEEKVKVRAMFDDQLKPVSQADPGDPVQVLGFKSAPEVGTEITATLKLDDVTTASSEDLSSTKIEENVSEEKEGTSNGSLALILKADTEGTLEAIVASVMQDEIEMVDSSVGAISEADVMLAHATKAEIIGFNVGMSGSAKKLAQIEKVKITEFNIIYKLIEYLEKKVLTLIEPTIDEEEMGEAKIEAVFTIREETIAGCSVTSGKIEKNHQIHIMRKERNIADAAIKSLKRGKEDIKTAKAGTECGVVFDQDVDFKVGDMLKSYRIVSN